jgi:L-lactate utilization protein LutB
LKLIRCKKSLEKNNFEVFIASDTRDAGSIFQERILPALEVRIASRGDSMTLAAIGVLDTLRANPDIQMIETFDPRVTH